jgi:dTDP-4-dehydrorhamnose 3,5-epimerase
MKVEKTALDGVLLITPPMMSEDFRGTNTEIYNEELYRKAGINNNFILDSVSTSRKHVLRGIHGDGHTTKLISCLHGSLYVIVVNNDYESPQYMQWTSFTISAQNRLQVLVPPKFGNSHLVMSDHAVFHYKLDAYYDRKSQFTILWNNRNYKFWWPISNPILSERDSLI